VSSKQRLSASVDADLVAAAQQAVTSGRAESVSAWINDALRLKVENDQRLQALDDFLAAYEAEHGEIDDEEMRQVSRKARERATVVRGDPAKQRPEGARRGRGAA
jgi:Arc/MetJ-type ribon-helix-helix transcriptional regulator